MGLTRPLLWFCDGGGGAKSHKKMPHRTGHRYCSSSYISNGIILLLLLLLGTLRVEALGGVFELKLRSFTNPSGRDADGVCCNGTTSGGSRTSGNLMSDLSGVRGLAQCRGECATKFRVCVKHYQATIVPDANCMIGEAVTEPFVGNNVTTSVDGLSPHHVKLFQFPFNFRWPGTFSLIIEAWHHPLNATQRLLTRMSIQQSLDIGETWHSRNWTNGDTTTNMQLTYDYRVRCMPDYYGDSCGQYCRPRDDKFGHYRCSPNGDKICYDGWTGDYCDKAICLPGCHETHGDCKMPNQCECHTGWEGPHCSQCIRYPGCKHGRCTKPYECECEEGWGGLFCNQDLNYCTNHKPCRNGGTCFNTGSGSYTCSCPPGFAGADCQERVDERCNCRNGGTCRENGTAVFCQCPEGWSGPTCELLTVTCMDSPCANGGTCVDGPVQVSCTCPPGFAGVLCETSLASQCRCVNGGTCDPFTGACTCPLGFSGPTCSTPVDNCAGKTCQNGGTCISLPGARHRCQCVLGWTGESCTVPVNICATLPCANGGTCLTLPRNDYRCECPPNFYGKDCSDLTCPCINGGMCVGTSCQCPSGFTGDKCEIPIHLTLARKDQAIYDEDMLSAEHVVLVVVVSVAVPLLVVIAVAVVYLLKKRKRQEQRRNDDLARMQNEANTVQSCMKVKCLVDPHNMIVNSLDIPQKKANKLSNLDLSNQFCKGMNSVDSSPGYGSGGGGYCHSVNTVTGMCDAYSPVGSKSSVCGDSACGEQFPSKGDLILSHPGHTQYPYMDKGGLLMAAPASSASPKGDPSWTSGLLHAPCPSPPVGGSAVINNVVCTSSSPSSVAHRHHPPPFSNNRLSGDHNFNHRLSYKESNNNKNNNSNSNSNSNSHLATEV